MVESNFFDLITRIVWGLRYRALNLIKQHVPKGNRKEVIAQIEWLSDFTHLRKRACFKFPKQQNNLISFHLRKNETHPNKLYSIT